MPPEVPSQVKACMRRLTVCYHGPWGFRSGAEKRRIRAMERECLVLGDAILRATNYSMHMPQDHDKSRAAEIARVTYGWMDDILNQHWLDSDTDNEPAPRR